jgi:hypothetical protein
VALEDRCPNEEWPSQHDLISVYDESAARIVLYCRKCGQAITLADALKEES